MDLFTKIYFVINDKIVKYFNTDRYELYFDSLFLRLLVKENK